MEWTNKKDTDSNLSRCYPNDDVKIYSSRMVADDKSIDILVFTCQRLTQHKIVNNIENYILRGDEYYCDPQDIIFDKEFDSNRDFWYRGTHPSSIEVIIKNGIENEHEIFAVKLGNRKCLEYGNNRELDFEKVGKLITIYKADAFAPDSSGNPSDWYKVNPINKSSISPIRIVGIFTSREQADDFMHKVTTLS